MPELAAALAGALSAFALAGALSALALTAAAAAAAGRALTGFFSAAFSARSLFGGSERSVCGPFSAGASALGSGFGAASATGAGFSPAEVNKAFDWLGALAEQRPAPAPARADGPTRVYFGPELDKLDARIEDFKRRSKDARGAADGALDDIEAAAKKLWEEIREGFDRVRKSYTDKG